MITRKIITKLLDFAELCNENAWPTTQAHSVFELALELAKQRDRKMLREMRNRVGVEEQ